MVIMEAGEFIKNKEKVKEQQPVSLEKEHFQDVQKEMPMPIQVVGLETMLVPTEQVEKAEAEMEVVVLEVLIQEAAAAAVVALEIILLMHVQVVQE